MIEICKSFYYTSTLYITYTQSKLEASLLLATLLNLNIVFDDLNFL
jgi:hypothetical protein